MGMIIWDLREFRDPPKDPYLPRREGWSPWPSQDRAGVDCGGEDGQNAVCLRPSWDGPVRSGQRSDLQSH